MVAFMIKPIGGHVYHNVPCFELSSVLWLLDNRSSLATGANVDSAFHCVKISLMAASPRLLHLHCLRGIASLEIENLRRCWRHKISFASERLGADCRNRLSVTNSLALWGNSELEVEVPAGTFQPIRRISVILAIVLQSFCLIGDWIIRLCYREYDLFYTIVLYSLRFKLDDLISY